MFTMAPPWRIGSRIRHAAGNRSSQVYVIGSRFGSAASTARRRILRLAVEVTQNAVGDMMRARCAIRAAAGHALFAFRDFGYPQATRRTT